MRLDHVLVAVDFSPAWDNLKQRLGYLKPWGVRKLTLVHVLSTRYPAAPAETHRDAYTGELKAAADALQQQGHKPSREFCKNLIFMVFLPSCGIQTCRLMQISWR